jgi:peptidoglycan/LPS O-acetylase OafA/YrhL
VAWLGLVSYGIFLWHHDVIVWLVSHDVLDTFSAAPFLALTVIAVAIVVPIAALSYYLVERPLLRLKPGVRGRRLTPAGPRRGPAAAPSVGGARGEPGGPPAS